MEIKDKVNDPCLKASLELQSLLRSHFKQRQLSKRKLKDKICDAELEVERLRQSVFTYAEELKAERLKYEALQCARDDDERRHASALLQQEKAVKDKIIALDKQAQLLGIKTEEYEHRMQSLQKREEELLQRENDLKTRQAYFEAGILPAQKQAEAEMLRMQRAREKAEQFLHEVMISSEAAERRRCHLENLYNFEMKYIELEKEESVWRAHVMREEIYAFAHIISSRLAHVSIAETKATERLRLVSQEFLSRKDTLELREKELNLRYQREQQVIKDEKERINDIKEAMRHDFAAVLENLRLLGDDSSLESEQLQVDTLRGIEKLLLTF